MMTPPSDRHVGRLERRKIKGTGTAIDIVKIAGIRDSPGIVERRAREECAFSGALFPWHRRSGGQTID